MSNHLASNQGKSRKGSQQSDRLLPGCRIPVKLYWHCWNLESGGWQYSVATWGNPRSDRCPDNQWVARSAFLDSIHQHLGKMTDLQVHLTPGRAAAKL